jgi:hypothetical protein
MFDTWGPFTLKSHDKNGIDDLYLQIRSCGTPNLEEGKGVYIVAVEDSIGQFLPRYVGKTVRQGFGTRLKQHFDHEKFAHLPADGAVSIFLIALAHSGIVNIGPVEDESKQEWAITHLELSLISTCSKLNEDLENKHRYSSDSLHVPGYIDEGPRDRDFPAAQALSKLLKT